MPIKLLMLIFLSYTWTVTYANVINDNLAQSATEEQQIRPHLEIHQSTPLAPMPPLPPMPPMPPMPILAALAGVPETSTVNKSISDAMLAARNATDAMNAVFTGMQDMHISNPIKNAAYSAEIITEKTQSLADGNQISNGAKLYIARNGDTINGRKVELIIRDDTGIAPELTKRLAQELVTNNKVDVLAGFGLSPGALATAAVATQAKKAMVVMNAAASVLTSKSPNIVRVSHTLPQPLLKFEWVQLPGQGRA